MARELKYDFDIKVIEKLRNEPFKQSWREIAKAFKKDGQIPSHTSVKDWVDRHYTPRIVFDPKGG